MDEERLRLLVRDIYERRVSVDEGIEALRSLPYEDIGFAKIDHHRSLRTGFPEVVFCQGKKAEQVVAIVSKILERQSNVLATRANQEMFEAVKAEHPSAHYHEEARAITVVTRPVETRGGQIAVVTAGTSDIPVAEEAAVTAEIMGSSVVKIYDVGVAGIHRLFDKHQELAGAEVIIVAAGMEGALASVVGGIVNSPVIAVPTSIGYGASFGGLAALLGMLNTCAAGVAVVNIDNGFAAGYIASLITRQ